MVTVGHVSTHANPSRTEGGLSALSGEVNVALVYRHYFERETSCQPDPA